MPEPLLGCLLRADVTEDDAVDDDADDRVD